jgi:hypothetical protein
MNVPSVINLREAVRYVIENNTNEGYPPNYFRRKTSCPDRELLRSCLDLLYNPNSINAVYKSLEAHPKMITLEDFIVRYGNDWGFTPDNIQKAKDSLDTFNSVPGKVKWS